MWSKDCLPVPILVLYVGNLQATSFAHHSALRVLYRQLYEQMMGRIHSSNLPDGRMFLVESVCREAIAVPAVLPTIVAVPDGGG
jgi:hypothetical protein